MLPGELPELWPRQPDLLEMQADLQRCQRCGRGWSARAEQQTGGALMTGGTPVTSKNPRRAGCRGAWTPEQDSQIIEMLAAGKTYREVSAAMGLTRGAVQGRVARLAANKKTGTSRTRRAEALGRATGLSAAEVIERGLISGGLTNAEER